MLPTIGWLRRGGAEQDKDNVGAFPGGRPVLGFRPVFPRGRTWSVPRMSSFCKDGECGESTEL